MIINDPAVLPGLEAAFNLYETALMANDIATLDALFHDAPETVRFGIGEMLYGHAEIAAFRRARPGGSPQRRVLRRQATTYGTDLGTTHLEFQPVGSERIGRQSQTWIRIGQSWKIVAAHVSLMGALA